MADRNFQASVSKTLKKLPYTEKHGDWCIKKVETEDEVSKVLLKTVLKSIELPIF